MEPLIKGDRVRHKVHLTEGTVTATPRAHSPAAQVILDGNSSRCYYRIVDLELLSTRVRLVPVIPSAPAPSAPALLIPPIQQATPTLTMNDLPLGEFAGHHFRIDLRDGLYRAIINNKIHVTGSCDNPMESAAVCFEYVIRYRHQLARDLLNKSKL